MRPRDARFWALVVAIGLASGFLAGLFGVGGGILMVPALVLLLRVDQRLAHGTSLTAIIPMALVGVTGYALGDSVDWLAAALLTLGAAGGAVIGTAALHRLPERALRLAFAAFLILTAARMFFEVGEPAGDPHLGLATAALLVLVGLFSGITAGLFGVGGGLIMVPAMVLLLSLPDALAKGTSLAVIVPTALIGTYRNARVGNTDLRLAAVLGVSGMVTAF
ncbi:MAG: sulfite exporter TauE/SafE family protein, partial [Thermoleophilia bacterium]|nr:sulfite exporter TauE/SafE family protein [Thermoleophilia bacterium]